MIAGFQAEFSVAGPIKLSIVCNKAFLSSVKKRTHKTVCTRKFLYKGGTKPKKMFTVRSRSDVIVYNVEQDQ